LQLGDAAFVVADVSLWSAGIEEAIFEARR